MQKKGVGKKYCSSRCKRRFYTEQNQDTLQERRAAWHRKNKWDGNWEDALARDKYSCQLCGVMLLPLQWRPNKTLVVHHRDGSGEKEAKNHSPENLQTLCPECHREFHTKINLVFVDGRYQVRGKIFEILNLKQVDTIGE
jgi:5-methylcytosine-specific restriction endonuclease McrA